MANPIAAGHSSFSLLDQELFFKELPIQGQERLLDAASGAGAYALAIAERRPEVEIYAFDLWADGITQLKEAVRERQLNNIKAEVVDLRKKLPAATDFFDACLLATVWHDFTAEGTQEAVITELKRVLKPDGVLALVEFKKIPGSPGPPLAIRLSPDEVEEMLSGHGFTFVKSSDVGPYNYLSVFKFQQ